MSKIQDIKSKLEKKNREIKEHDRRVNQHIRDNIMLYVALVVSGLLSSLAGISIGLGLRVVDGVVYVTADLPHIFFAILYAVLFPYFFEYGFHRWVMQLLFREPNNTVQYYTSGVMVAITFIGTALTAFSAMDVLVTSLGFFASFREIPPIVQRWIAFALPSMLLLNIAAGEVYRQFSSHAVLLREAMRELKETQLEADNEVELARIEAEKNIAVKEAAEYTLRASQDEDRIAKDRASKKWQNDKRSLDPAHSYGSETDSPGVLKEKNDSPS